MLCYGIHPESGQPTYGSTDQAVTQDALVKTLVPYMARSFGARNKEKINHGNNVFVASDAASIRKKNDPDEPVETVYF
jgi:hypothetical protein